VRDTVLTWHPCVVAKHLLAEIAERTDRISGDFNHSALAQPNERCLRREGDSRFDDSATLKRRGSINLKASHRMSSRKPTVRRR
jgi:hypothetical protein